MAKFKKGKKVKYGGGAMVLASQADMARPASGGPMLKEAPAGLLYQAGAIVAGRKLVTSELDKAYSEKARQLGKKKPEDLSDSEKADVMRSLGWKALFAGYVGLRTFEKDDMTGAMSMGAFVNGAVLLADSV